MHTTTNEAGVDGFYLPSSLPIPRKNLKVIDGAHQYFGSGPETQMTLRVGEVDMGVDLRLGSVHAWDASFSLNGAEAGRVHGVVFKKPSRQRRLDSRDFFDALASSAPDLMGVARVLIQSGTYDPYFRGSLLIVTGWDFHLDGERQTCEMARLALRTVALNLRQCFRALSRAYVLIQPNELVPPGPRWEGWSSELVAEALPTYRQQVQQILEFCLELKLNERLGRKAAPDTMLLAPSRPPSGEIGDMFKYGAGETLRQELGMPPLTSEADDSHELCQPPSVEEAKNVLALNMVHALANCENFGPDACGIAGIAAEIPSMVWFNVCAELARGLVLGTRAVVPQDHKIFACARINAAMIGFAYSKTAKDSNAHLLVGDIAMHYMEHPSEAVHRIIGEGSGTGMMEHPVIGLAGEEPSPEKAKAMLKASYHVFSKLASPLILELANALDVGSQ